MLRGILWLVGGLVLLAVAVLGTAPELRSADTSATVGLAGLVLAAGVPGLALIGWTAWRRRGAEPTAEERADTRCVPLPPSTRRDP
jgi:drug/metabolite transporter (DMT)-like permease